MKKRHDYPNMSRLLVWRLRTVVLRSAVLLLVTVLLRAGLVVFLLFTTLPAPRLGLRFVQRLVTDCLAAARRLLLYPAPDIILSMPVSALDLRFDVNSYTPSYEMPHEVGWHTLHLPR